MLIFQYYRVARLVPDLFLHCSILLVARLVVYSNTTHFLHKRQINLSLRDGACMHSIYTNVINDKCMEANGTTAREENYACRFYNSIL